VNAIDSHPFPSYQTISQHITSKSTMTINNNDDDIFADQQQEQHQSKGSKEETKETTTKRVDRTISFGTIVLSAATGVVFFSLLIVFVNKIIVGFNESEDESNTFQNNVGLQVQVIIFCSLLSILPAIVLAYYHDIDHSILFKDKSNGKTIVTQTTSAIVTRIIIHILLWTTGSCSIVYIVVGALSLFGTNQRNLIVGVATLGLISTLYHSWLFYSANCSIARTRTTNSGTNSAAENVGQEDNRSETLDV